jgi:hypothetical protein
MRSCVCVAHCVHDPRPILVARLAPVAREPYSVAPRPEPLESYAHHILDAAIAAARAAAGFRPPFTTSTSWRQFRVPAAFRARLGLAKAFAPVSTAEWAVVHGDAPAAGAARSATGSDLKLAA